MGYAPISDYGVIGTMTSAALVASDGSIDWCCLPRFKSSSVFARILDDEKGGCFGIRPSTPFDPRQEYISDTNGIRLAKEPEFARRLAQYNPTIYL